MGIRFSIVPSNNHASPTGALPFLLPSSSTSTASESSPAIPSMKLQRWAQAEVSREGFKPQPLTSHEITNSERSHPSEREPSGMRYEAYISLVDRQIRHTWVTRHSPVIPQSRKATDIRSPQALLPLPRALQLRRGRVPILHRPLLFQWARPHHPRLQPSRGRQVGATQAFGRHRRRVTLHGVRARVRGSVRPSGRPSVFLRQGRTGSVRR